MKEKEMERREEEMIGERRERYGRERWEEETRREKGL